MRVATRASISSRRRSALRARQRRVEKRIERVDRQAQRLENDEGGFVDGVGRAMAVDEPGRVEPADGVAEEVAQRREDREALVVGAIVGGRLPIAFPHDLDD